MVSHNRLNGSIRKSPILQSPCSLLLLWLAVFFSVVSSAAALEFKDIAGYWSGEGKKIDPVTNKVTTTLPVQIQAFNREGKNVVLYNLAGICVAVAPEYREDGFSFLWGGLKIDAKLVDGRLTMEHLDALDAPPIQISLSRQPIIDLKDDQISGLYSGRIQNPAPALEGSPKIEYDVQLEIRLEADSAYAAMKGTRIGLRGQSKTYSIEFIKVERYDNCFILWTQTPEETKAQKERMLAGMKPDDPAYAQRFVDGLEQERVYLRFSKEGAMDVQFNIQKFGNAIGSLSRVAEEDASGAEKKVPE